MSDESRLERKDVEFLKRRKRFVRSWNLVGSLLLAGLAALLVGLFVRVPRLVNPGQVALELKLKSIGQPTLEIMAVMLPVAVLACFAITAVIIVFGFVIFANERRYTAIIERLTQAQSRGAESL